MDDERKRSPWIAWCSGIVVLLGLYVGAYAAMVESHGWRIGYHIPSYRVPMRPDKRWRYPRVVEVVFSPIHRFDRRIRREEWEPFLELEPASLDGIP